MSAYKKIDFSKLHFAQDSLPIEEALKDVKPLTLKESNLDVDGTLKVNKVEKDYKNKCVKLVI